MLTAASPPSSRKPAVTPRMKVDPGSALLSKLLRPVDIYIYICTALHSAREATEVDAYTDSPVLNQQIVVRDNEHMVVKH